MTPKRKSQGKHLTSVRQRVAYIVVKYPSQELIEGIKRSTTEKNSGRY